MFEPIKLLPTCKNYLWGGKKLRQFYHKEGEGDIVAESWELSTHKDGHSMIASGINQGCTLQEYIEKEGSDILGLKATGTELPILVKLIDAKDYLSIQVHPDNEFAMQHENDNGKTEMWLILECEPDAYLYCGVDRDVTEEELRVGIEDGTFLSLLRKVPVEKGDIFFIPAGTIHAIGKGIVICEIQQCSNVTYRLYDFDRTDKDGNKRPLHIEKGLTVSTLQKKSLYKKPAFTMFQDESTSIQLLLSNDYFTVYCYDIKKSAMFATSKASFAALTLLEGEGVLYFENGNMHVQKGETVFLPAQEASFQMKGVCRWMLVTL